MPPHIPDRPGASHRVPLPRPVPEQDRRRLPPELPSSARSPRRRHRGRVPRLRRRWCPVATSAARPVRIPAAGVSDRVESRSAAAADRRRRRPRPRRCHRNHSHSRRYLRNVRRRAPPRWRTMRPRPRRLGRQLRHNRPRGGHPHRFPPRRARSSPRREQNPDRRHPCAGARRWRRPVVARWRRRSIRRAAPRPAAPHRARR